MSPLYFKSFKILVLLFFLIISLPLFLSAQNSLESLKFDLKFHKLHQQIDEEKFKCTFCHNVNEIPNKKTFEIKENAKTFVKPLSDICHECHRERRSGFEKAPATCFTCHKSFDALKNIKPQNHQLVDWKTAHGLRARLEGQACFSCHTNSRCVQCHAQRNDVKMRNHKRNFLFFHSIQARMEPHRCDTCHTKNECTKCHLGK